MAGRVRSSLKRVSFDKLLILRRKSRRTKRNQCIRKRQKRKICSAPQTRRKKKDLRRVIHVSRELHGLVPHESIDFYALTAKVDSIGTFDLDLGLDTVVKVLQLWNSLVKLVHPGIGEAQHIYGTAKHKYDPWVSKLPIPSK